MYYYNYSLLRGMKYNRELKLNHYRVGDLCQNETLVLKDFYIRNCNILQFIKLLPIMNDSHVSAPSQLQ